MNLNQKNFSISQLKGLKPSQDNLLQIRLADKSMVKKLNDGQEHLFAFEPAGNDKYWKEIEALIPREIYIFLM
nr:DUF3103 family protein [Pseudoalteromonas sp. NBT06-2]